MNDPSHESAPAPGRTIPDGGLAASGLPEWMQSTPEWVQRAPESGGLEPKVRDVPVPDHSIIDPVSLLTIDDLPVWLRQVAVRPIGLGDETAVVTPSVSLPEPGIAVPSGSIRRTDPATQPWWTSDRVMVGLLIAVVLTILFVLVMTIRQS
jgi:hypothetical protein